MANSLESTESSEMLVKKIFCCLESQRYCKCCTSWLLCSNAFMSKTRCLQLSNDSFVCTEFQWTKFYVRDNQLRYFWKWDLVFRLYNNGWRDANSLRAWAFQFLPSKVIEIDGNNFSAKVLRDSKPWLIDFYGRLW